MGNNFSREQKGAKNETLKKSTHKMSTFEKSPAAKRPTVAKCSSARTALLSEFILIIFLRGLTVVIIIIIIIKIFICLQKNTSTVMLGTGD